MSRKTLEATECDLKFSDSAEGTFEGYLSVFGNVDSYGDTVFKGAYKDTLSGRKRMPPMLLNHDARAVPVGVWESMKEDDTGLRVKGRFLATDTGKEVHQAVKEGAMTGLSIGYRATKFEENDHGGLNLLKIDLREGSVVTMPAEDDARIDVVKFEELFGSVDEIGSQKEFELILRDAGYTRKMAKALMSQFKSICLRDVDETIEENKALRRKLSEFEGQQARIMAGESANNLLSEMRNQQ